MSMGIVRFFPEGDELVSSGMRHSLGATLGLPNSPLKRGNNRKIGTRKSQILEVCGTMFCPFP